MKKLLALLLAVAMVFGLAACGGETKTNTNSTAAAGGEGGTPYPADSGGRPVLPAGGGAGAHTSSVSGADGGGDRPHLRRNRCNAYARVAACRLNDN